MVKRQCSCSMDMRFFWVADAVDQGKLNIKYNPGKENLVDYQSKHVVGRLYSVQYKGIFGVPNQRQMLYM